MSEQEYKVIFARQLRQYMAASGTTQQDLAERLGVSQSTVSSWCNGEKMARMDKVQALADFFRIQKSDLLEPKPVYYETDAFRDRLFEERGALFDLLEKATSDQLDIVERILAEIVPGESDS